MFEDIKEAMATMETYALNPLCLKGVPETRWVSKDLVDFINTFPHIGTDRKKWEDLFSHFVSRRMESVSPVSTINLAHDVFNGIPVDDLNGKNYTYMFVLADAVLLSKDCPNDIAEKVFQSIATVTNEFYFVRQFFKRDMEISDNVIDYIADRHYSQIPFETPIQFGNLNNQDKLIKAMYEKGYMIETNACSLLKFINDKNLLSQILKDSNYNEEMVSAVINDTSLSEEYRDRLFDIGCDPTRIKEFTPHMIEVLSEQVWETMFDIGLKERYGTLKGCETNAYMLCSEVLRQMMTRKALPESRQIDLANRLVAENSKSYDFIAAALIDSTDSPKVLEIMSHIKSANKNSVYKNPACPEEVVLKKARDYQKTLESQIKTGKKPSPRKIESLLEIMEKHVLPDDIYKTVLKTGCGQNTIVNFSKDVPDNILKLLTRSPMNIDGKEINIPDMISIEANLIYNARQQKLNMNTIKEIIKEIHCTGAVPVDKSAPNLSESKKKEYDIIFENEKDKIDTYINFLNKTVEGNESISEKNKYRIEQFVYRANLYKKRITATKDKIFLSPVGQMLNLRREYDKIKYSPYEKWNFILQNKDKINNTLKEIQEHNREELIKAAKKDRTAKEEEWVVCE